MQNNAHYDALIMYMTCLDYCNVVFSCLPASIIAPLQHVQNASAAGVVFGLHSSEHNTASLSQLLWLPRSLSESNSKSLILLFISYRGTCPSNIGQSNSENWQDNYISVNYVKLYMITPILNKLFQENLPSFSASSTLFSRWRISTMYQDIGVDASLSLVASSASRWSLRLAGSADFSVLRTRRPHQTCEMCFFCRRTHAVEMSSCITAINYTHGVFKRNFFFENLTSFSHTVMLYWSFFKRRTINFQCNCPFVTQLTLYSLHYTHNYRSSYSQLHPPS